MATPQEKVNKIFVKAAARGDIPTMEVALKAGADIEGTGGFWEMKMSALNNAALMGNEASARFLVQRGATVDAADGDGVTPLGYAVTGGHRGVAGILLAAGARLDIRSKAGRSPLDEALRRKDPLMRQLLMRHAKECSEKPAAAPRPEEQQEQAPEAQAVISAAQDIAPDKTPPEKTPLEKMEDADIVVFRSRAGARTLEDIFNFAALERTTLVSTNDGPVEAITRQSFAALEDAPLLQRAFDEHRRRGGTALEADVFGPGWKAPKLRVLKP